MPCYYLRIYAHGIAIREPYYSPFRFVILAFFGLLSFSNAMQWLTFSCFPEVAQKMFNLSRFELNFLSMIYMLVYIAFALFSCIGIERFGLRACLLLGSALNCLGALLKFVLADQGTFLTLLIAQLSNSIAQLFVLSIPPVLSEAWFPSSWRAKATSIGGLCNALGSALGVLLSPFIINEWAKSHEQGVFVLFLIHLSMSVAAFFGLALLPITPAHAGGDTEANAVVTEDTRGDNAEPDARQSSPLIPSGSSPSLIVIAKAVACDRDALLSILGVSMSQGFQWAVASVYIQVLGAMEVSEEHSGLMLFAGIAVGLFISVFFSHLVDKWRVYKTPFLVFLFVSGVCYAGVTAMLFFSPFTEDPDGNATLVEFQEPGRAPLWVIATLYALSIINGAFQCTCYPVGQELVMELAHGAPSSVLSGLVMWASNLFSFLLVMAATALLGESEEEDRTPTREQSLNASLAILSSFLLGTFFITFVRPYYRRYHSEK